MNKRGFVLIVAMVFLTVLFIGGSSFLYMVTNEAKYAERQIDTQKAFFLAESGIERAIWRIKNDNIISPETYTLKAGSAPLNYLEEVSITVNIRDLGSGNYQVSSSSRVGNSSKTINTLLQRHPPSAVFDYGYFVNNWGWFYGPITSNGDVRSNGRFDFRQRPSVEGDIYAGFEIDDGGQGIRGSGGDPANQHPFSEKLDMPNLYNMSYYETKAIAERGRVVIDGVTLINGVFGDDGGESGNIVLVGTPSKPIQITGTVVVRGDVVIKGTVSGQGTIYACRNIYVADSIKYKNAPSSPRPASNNPDAAYQWVMAHKDDDLVGFAAAENIILGDYTGRTGGQWYSDLWLFDMGEEDAGRDGIPNTGDTYEGDRAFQKEYEDMDGDGIKDYNYNWSNVRTQAPIGSFYNCPQGVSNFGDIADNRMTRLDGAFYTNHAVAGRTGPGFILNGAIVSKDEAIIIVNKLTINYDERVNSRYSRGPNRAIDLPLPFSKEMESLRWWE